MNLATAQSLKRAKEIGLRKVVGARRNQIIKQFFYESIIIVLLTYLIAMFAAEITLPYLSQLIGSELAFNYNNIFFLLSLFLIVFFTIIVSGSYPALLLSSFKPIKILKGTIIDSKNNTVFRKSLVVFQFTMSVILIITSLSLNRQLNYMKNKNLGVSINQKVVIPIRGGINVSTNYEMAKKEFRELPAIQQASFSSSIPGRYMNNYGCKLVGKADDKNQLMDHLLIDQDFITQFNIEIISGRNFDKSFSTDTIGPFILNETAAKALGFANPKDAIGQKINTGAVNRNNTIIGIAKDFHYFGLQKRITPMVFEWNPQRYSYLTLKINTNNTRQSLQSIENKWELLYPEIPFVYFFLDNDFNKQYQKEEKAGFLIIIFTILGIIVACLGLYGLASFSAELKIKEIGIRKALGGSVSNITTMLSLDYLKLILYSNIIAWPIAYFVLSKWLQNFPYQNGISIYLFIISTLLTLISGILTVSIKAYQSANRNPIESLRYE